VTFKIRGSGGDRVVGKAATGRVTKQQANRRDAGPRGPLKAKPHDGRNMPGECIVPRLPSYFSRLAALSQASRSEP